MSARQRIADALTAAALPEVQAVYTSKPDTVHAGAAWPVLREVSRDGVLCAVLTHTYDVFVVLEPGYAPAAADQADALIGPLVLALEPLGEWIQPADLVALAFESGNTVPALRVRITPDPEEES